MRAADRGDLYHGQPGGRSPPGSVRPQGVSLKRPRLPGRAARGGLILALLALLGLLAPWISTWPPDRQDLSRRLQGPSVTHPMGMDDLGRDVLSRALWGTRVSLTTGLLVVLIAATVGTVLGAVAGLAGGLIDALITACIDLLLGFPGVLLAIAVVAVLGPHLINLVVALSLIGWVGYARLVRSQVLRLRPLEYLKAAQAVGVGNGRLLLRHVLPNLLGPLLVQAALGLGGVILAEAGLSFLGLGVPPPTASWGSMLRTGSQNLLDAPHLTVVPGAALFLAILGANLLGEGLGERWDPRRRPGGMAW